MTGGMTNMGISAYRWLIGVIVLAIGLAAVMTYLASVNARAWANLTGLVNAVPVPARFRATGSDFPDLTAIYFLWASPVFPASLAAVVTHFWRPDDGDTRAHRPDDFEVKMGFGSLFMIAFGGATLWAMDGEEVLGMPVGTQLPQLLVLGWIPFAIGGCLMGMGVIGLRRVFAPLS